MNDENINEVKMTDEKGLNLPWSYLFFILHKHCNIDKFKIMEYTLPQLIDLMEETDKYMQFEVSTRLPMMPGLPFGQGGQVSEDEEYKEATEDDINDFASFLGG